jgi:hypothetical protein
LKRQSNIPKIPRKVIIDFKRVQSQKSFVEGGWKERGIRKRNRRGKYDQSRTYAVWKYHSESSLCTINRC